ncbi:MAG TPA: thermonuclease family protein [Kiritimatiellia bacterium]|nr:thermonuclease family protein [Kiritimatiellia bacterium]
MKKNPPSLRLLGLAVFLLALVAPPDASAAKKWREYTGCRVIPNASNDGDSFHVKPTNIKTRTYLFRLYFVDTPESETSLPERLQVQADYFGIPDPKDVVKVGKEAVKFTEKFLEDGNFTVYSRLADALGRSAKDRDYAMVMNAAGQDLGTELVRNGLARVFGNGTDLSELDAYKRDEIAWWRRLRQAELEAKKEKRGAWAYAGVPVSRMDALLAPRQVAEQDVVLARPIYIYPLDNPASQQPLGQLRAGVTVRVVKGISPDRAHVRFSTSDGRSFEGAARFADLGI